QLGELANMRNAVQEVLTMNASIRTAAKRFGVSSSALHRKIKKYKNLNEYEKENFYFGRTHGFKRILTDEEEDLLAKYLVDASQMCYELTLKDTAALAYQYAVANNKLIPESWRENQCAGIEWIYLFRQRHNSIGLRTPEATSLGRATSFNKTHVTLFFRKLKEVMEKHNLTALQIHNCDETGVTNVHKPPKISAPKHQKQ
ncbi:hypothetical protein ILUMI_16827, partial [Ignelater luminosus]